MSANFYASLPTKRMAAGCILRDETGRVLLLKLAYKPGWDIPGGVVEANESPKAAAEREVREEIGLTIQAGRLLLLDYNSYADHPDKTESLIFFFDGGTLSADRIAALTPAEGEIERVAFFAPQTLPEAMSRRVRQRVQIALECIERGTTAYLENQVRV
jgi:8-oxo-dGTP pyrophosphatase MutT (NUDIX family)